MKSKKVPCIKWSDHGVIKYHRITNSTRRLESRSNHTCFIKPKMNSIQDQSKNTTNAPTFEGNQENTYSNSSLTTQVRMIQHQNHTNNTTNENSLNAPIDTPTFECNQEYINNNDDGQGQQKQEDTIIDFNFFHNLNESNEANSMLDNLNYSDNDWSNFPDNDWQYM